MIQKPPKDPQMQNRDEFRSIPLNMFILVIMWHISEWDIQQSWTENGLKSAEMIRSPMAGQLQRSKSFQMPAAKQPWRPVTLWPMRTALDLATRRTEALMASPTPNGGRPAIFVKLKRRRSIHTTSHETPWKATHYMQFVRLNHNKMMIMMIIIMILRDSKWCLVIQILLIGLAGALLRRPSSLDEDVPTGSYGTCWVREYVQIRLQVPCWANSFSIFCHPIFWKTWMPQHAHFCLDLDLRFSSRFWFKVTVMCLHLFQWGDRDYAAKAVVLQRETEDVAWPNWLMFIQMFFLHGMSSIQKNHPKSVGSGFLHVTSKHLIFHRVDFWATSPEGREQFTPEIVKTFATETWGYDRSI